MKQYHVVTCIPLVIFSFLLFSCGASSSQSSAALEEAKQAIAASNAIYFQAFEKGDSSIFIDRYAEDCCIMAPDGPALCGPIAPLEFFRVAYYGLGLRNGKFTTTAVYGDGAEYVTEEGLWQSFDANGAQFDNGKFLVLWKKTKKGWKMYRDSFSSNNKQR
jgi:ketosteroid isomerase-like protein